jgi:sucrose-6-phosphate hydrolase SacC (GH32 family)
LDDLELELLEIRTEIEPGNASEIVFNVRDAMILYETAKQEISVDGQRAAVPLLEGKLRLKIYGDRTGLEVFVSDGLCYLPIPFNTNPENRKVFLESQAGAARVRKLEVHQLRSAWVLP